jgi:hypothetical protein
MDFTRRIYGYCERGLSDGFWAEPFNAVTNGAFIFAALFGLIIALRLRRLDGPTGWLIALTFTVGVGSFLFHTYAQVWAAMSDTIPILMFILSYFAIAMNRFGGFGWGRSLALMLACLVLLIAASYFLRLGVDFLSGVRGGPDDGEAGSSLRRSALIVGFLVLAMAAWVFVCRTLLGIGILAAAGLGVVFFTALIGLAELADAYFAFIFKGARSYLPAMLALLGVGFWLHASAHKAGLWLIVVAGIFALSLTFRALDQPLCANFLYGTHWLWHVLNGIVLGTLIIAVIRHGQALDAGRTTG